MVGTDAFLVDAAGNPMRVDIAQWTLQDIESRRVALTSLANGGEVSTVFLGVDHGFGDGPPVLWESLPSGAEETEADDDA